MAKVIINAHLLSGQAGYRSAGIHGYIYHTLRHLPAVAPHHEYHVLVGAGTPPPIPGLIVQRAAFATHTPLRRIIWEQTIQPQVVRRLGGDIYHGMAFVAPLGLRHVPRVVTVYDLSFMRYPHGLSRARRWYLQTFSRQTCQAAHWVIAISQSTANDLVSLWGISPQKIIVAVPGVGEQFAPLPPDEVAAFRLQHGLPERFILHLGTLEPRKNLPMLLRAYAALPRTLQEAVHLVLGGGKGWGYQAVFQTIAAHQLEQTVHIPGYIADEALPFWYNAADALVYPSLYEGWGLPVSEAMACGCPTVVSDVSSLPEAVGETGLRLPPDDEAAWTMALRQIIEDAEWRLTSGQTGQQRAKQFTWLQTARQTVSAYRI